MLVWCSEAGWAVWIAKSLLLRWGGCISGRVDLQARSHSRQCPRPFGFWRTRGLLYAMDDADRSLTSWAAREFADARGMIDAVLSDAKCIERVEVVAERLAQVFAEGGKVMACGNGGSSCDAMHFCEEFTGRFRFNRPALGAIACVDPGHLTCTANDFGYDEVFSRWVEALGRAGDALVVLSTSGNSRNIARAVDAAKERGLVTIGLLGKGGGELRGRCDFEWIVRGPTDDAGVEKPTFADRIQEVHMLILHVLIGVVERRLMGADGAERHTERPIIEIAPALRRQVVAGQMVAGQARD